MYEGWGSGLGLILWSKRPADIPILNNSIRIRQCAPRFSRITPFVRLSSDGTCQTNIIVVSLSFITLWHFIVTVYRIDHKLELQHIDTEERTTILSKKILLRLLRVTLESKLSLNSSINKYFFFADFVVRIKALQDFQPIFTTKTL